MAGALTATGVDIFNAITKRLAVQGHLLSDREVLTLTVDVMNVINTDNANVVAHAATEIASNKVRPFVRSV